MKPANILNDGFRENRPDIEQLANAIAMRVAEKLEQRTSRRFLSREEYAKTTGLGLRTIDRAIAEGRLEIERSGRRVLIPVGAMIQKSTA